MRFECRCVARRSQGERCLNWRCTGERPFDQRPVPGATVKELNHEYAEAHYLPRAFAQEILDDTHRSLDQQLRSSGLLVGNVPTWGALLGFGRDPQGWIPGANVQFLRIDGLEVTDPVCSQKVLTGGLGDVLRQLDELLRLNISVHTKVATGSREVRWPDYPVAALRQLARNAVLHRRYEGTQAPIHVYWYSDRIEILSPGGLHGRVTPENLGDGVVDYRNPLVAEIMHHLGFAQCSGLGIPFARKALKENGNPEPRFDFQPTWVAVTVEAVL